MTFREIVRGAAFPVAALVFLLALSTPDALWAQEAGAELREMRHFWHVFVAYAIAWILLLGWLVTIVRRLRRVEERLGNG